MNKLAPKNNEIYEALDDLELSYILHFRTPSTSSGKCVFPKGQKLIVKHPYNNTPEGFYCIPVEYDKLEKELIPLSDKEEATYSDYTIFVETEVLHEKFAKSDIPPIQYMSGDATDPKGRDSKVIAHICNDIGGWGKGFVTALSNKWKSTESEYRNWYKSGELNADAENSYPEERKFKLGNVQFVKADHDIWVANMIAQRGIAKNEEAIPPIRYDAVRACLAQVRLFAQTNNCSVHMPRIGTGLAGGDWESIELIVTSELIAHNIKVSVYDLE